MENTPRETEISIAISVLENITEELQGMLGQLVNRLSPVLLPDSSTPSTIGSNTTKVIHTPLAQSIDKETQKIYATIQSITDVLDRLSL